MCSRAISINKIVTNFIAYNLPLAPAGIRACQYYCFPKELLTDAISNGDLFDETSVEQLCCPTFIANDDFFTKVRQSLKNNEPYVFQTMGNRVKIDLKFTPCERYASYYQDDKAIKILADIRIPIHVNGSDIQATVCLLNAQHMMLSIVERGSLEYEYRDGILYPSIGSLIIALYYQLDRQYSKGYIAWVHRLLTIHDKLYSFISEHGSVDTVGVSNDFDVIDTVRNKLIEYELERKSFRLLTRNEELDEEVQYKAFVFYKERKVRRTLIGREQEAFYVTELGHDLFSIN